MLTLSILALGAIYGVLALEAWLSPIYANNALTRVQDAMEERAIRRACEIRAAE